MGMTLSHTTALQVIRQLRAEGAVLQQMDHTSLAHPHPWNGKRWNMSAFNESSWLWPRPQKGTELHALVPSTRERITMDGICSHVFSQPLPANAILFLDERASVVGPEFLFVQMAATLPLAQSVLLGYELCGTFARSGMTNAAGPIIDKLASATSVESIRNFIASLGKRIRGIHRAQSALRFVHDGAASLPEAVLATMYELPKNELGYGMGPITLNPRKQVPRTHELNTTRTRFPDLLFSFARIGINYDGEHDHLDLEGLETQARIAGMAASDEREMANSRAQIKRDEVRSKAVDDMYRNREFLTCRYIVLPMTKEDLYEYGHLDSFTKQLLMIAEAFFGTDVAEFVSTIDDYGFKRDRCTLLESLLTQPVI